MNRNMWSKEEGIYFKSLLDQYQSSVAFEEHRKKYPYRTDSSMREYMNRNKLYGQKPDYSLRKGSWSEEEKAYLVELSNTHSRCECVELFQKKYNRSKKSIISMFSRTLHLKSNDEAVKKVKKERCGIGTRYQKGVVPQNHLPLGTIVIWSGYKHIKVKDESINVEGTNKNNFMLYHRYVYEQHNGKIPEGHHVCFIDGDPMNCDIDNLISVSGNAERIMLTNGGYLKHGREVAEAAQKYCQLRLAIKELKKKTKDDKK